MEQNKLLEEVKNTLAEQSWGTTANFGEAIRTIIDFAITEKATNHEIDEAWEYLNRRVNEWYRKECPHPKMAVIKFGDLFNM